MNANASVDKASEQAFCLHVHLLGTFHIDCDGTLVTTVNTPRLQSLLAYLVLNAKAPLSRKFVAFKLWPDSSEAHARGSLRKLLFQLMNALPAPNRFLDVNAQTVHWRPDASFTLDVHEFEHAVNRAGTAAALQAAVDLYRGDLLPSCYEDWILPERERLRQVFLSAQEHLILMLENERDFFSAIDCAQTLLRHDPFREQTYRHLIRLFAITSNRASALRTYHACATILRQELGVEPSPATRQVYEQILNVPESPTVETLAATVSLVGRQDEWARLQHAWRRACAGQSHMILISGEAGIGKTRLAEEMMAWARRQGIATASARCYAAEGGLAWAPVAAWLRSRPLPPLAPHWRREIARVLPEVLANDEKITAPGPLSEMWQRQHLFQALSQALLGDNQPLLLFLDDIQWSDRETLEWMQYTLQSRSAARLMVLATIRPEEVGEDHPLSALLTALLRNDQVTEIALDRFKAPETAALAEQISASALDPDFAARLHRETEGNPLFVIEFLRAQILNATERNNEPPVSCLPATVQSVLRARMVRLSPTARELAAVAACVGREFSIDVLHKASGCDLDAFVRALDELWHRRIVREHGISSYDFTHDKLREVIHADLSPARRRMLHLQIAEALQALHAGNLGAMSGEIAAHLEQAGATKEAIPFYERAAETARNVLANQDALALYRRGLNLIECLPPADVPRDGAVRLNIGCGDLLEILGRHDQARAAYHAALKYLSVEDPLGAARLHRRIGNTFKSQGRYADAMVSYGRAESTFKQAPDDLSPGNWNEWIELQFNQFDLNYGRADLSEMIRLTESVRSLIEQHGGHTQRARLYWLIVQIHLRRDRYFISDETLSYVRAAATEAQLSEELHHGDALRFATGFALLWRGELEEAEQELLAALAWDEQVGYTYEKTLTLTYLSVLYRMRGQVEQVRRYAALALETAAASDLPSYGATAHANQAWLAWRDKNLREVRTRAEAALRLWPESYPFQWTALFPLIALLVRRNQIGQAVNRARLLCGRLQQRLPDELTERLQRAIRAYEQGHLTTAGNHLRQMLKLGREIGHL